ncbi:MAG: rRNA maturation RNase YbeY [bacterium]
MATVRIKNRTRTDIKLKPLSEFAQKALEATREWRDAELSITFVGDRAMQELNGKWRGKPRPTDVLSFPMDEPAAPGGLLLMGDIIIAPNQAREDAAEEGATPARKFRELIMHSILHLMGFDHETLADAKKMEKQRIALLKKAGLG